MSTAPTHDHHIDAGADLDGAVVTAPLHLPVGLMVGHTARPLRAALDLTEELERLGIDFVSVGDSGAETFGMLGALAARTSRIGLVSGIATWSRSPVTMAHGARTVQNLSGGRHTLGIGPMPRDWAVQHHGMAFDPVLARMREYLRAVRACLDASPQQPTDVDGTYFPSHGFTGHPMTATQRVPMLAAATLPAMVRTAAELTDGVMLNCIHPVEWLTGPGPALIAQGLERGGRTRAELSVGLMRFCAVAADRSAAYDHVRRAIAFYFAVPYLRTLLEPFGYARELREGEAAIAAGDQQGAIEAVSDRMVEAIAIAGTAQEVIDQVHAYARHVDWIQLVTTMNVSAQAGHEQSLRVARLIGAARRAGRRPNGGDLAADRTGAPG